MTVRLWTSLLDASAYPAGELLALYARRWDIEVFTKELKVDLRGGTTVLQSHTLVTAAQEILALVRAFANPVVAGDNNPITAGRIRSRKALRGICGSTC